MRKITKAQKIKEIKTKPFHGERSPYWEWTKDRQLSTDSHDSDGKLEVAQANPDVLPEMEIAAPSTPQLIMGEAVQHLQGRQREVYLLTMREGKSLAEAAEILHLAKGTAQKYKERAIKFIETWCRQAIAKGRV